MNILLLHNKLGVHTYAESMARSLREDYGHKVIELDKTAATLTKLCEDFANGSDIDHIIDVDSGRNVQGEYNWLAQFDLHNNISCPVSAVFIDSHGRPDLHSQLASWYDNVFFAGWIVTGKQ